MEALHEYDIDLCGLKNGEHHFSYRIDEGFFEHFSPCEFENPRIDIELRLLKAESFLEQHFSGRGSVQVVCDLTNVPFDLTIKPALDFLVKFGPEYDDDDDEVLILPYGSKRLNAARYIYEMVVLSLPQKRVHPDVRNGAMRSEMLDLLKALQPDSDEHKAVGRTIDPRWAKLKDLLNR